MYKSKFKPRRLGVRKAGTTTRTAPVKSKQAVVSLVKSVMAREIETKYVQQSITNTASNSPITNADVYSCLPRLVQDQGEGNAYERMGTKITPKSLKVTCHVSLTPGIERSTAIIVHWFMLTAKQFKSYSTLPANVNMARLLRTGDFVQYADFNGSIDRSALPVNTTEFSVIKRGSFKLSKNTGFTQDSTASGNQPIAGPLYKSWSVTIPTPAKLTYEQDNNTPRVVYYPNNFAPFLVVGYTHQDGSTPDFTNQDIAIRHQAHLWYDDA